MTIQEMEIKRWLNRAFYADKKAKALEMLVRQCRERAEGLSRCSEGNDRGRSDSAENSTENALMKLANIEERARRQREEAICASDEIQQAIEQLGDFDLEAVLIHRYLLFHTDRETAEIMHYDERTVRRKRNAAIEKLSGCVLECPGTSVV